MAQVHVLLVGLVTGAGDAAGAGADRGVVVSQAAFDLSIAALRRLGYEADFCGVDEGPTAPATLIRMLEAHSYTCIVMSAGIRLVVRHSRLLERLVNLAQVTSPDLVVLFDDGPGDTVDAVYRWFPSPDAG